MSSKTTGRKRKASSEKGEKPQPAKKAKVVASKKGGKKAVQKSLPGIVLTCGSGDMSQLGLGSAENMLERKNPTVVKALEGKDVVDISAGSLHNAVVLATGEVYTWGCNDEHALGHAEDEWLPARAVGSLEDETVISVTCGACHTLALTEEGKTFSWGTYRDMSGVIGYNDKEDMRQTPGPTPKLSGVEIVQIASGDHHDLALTSTGTVYQWGDIGLGLRSSDRKKKTKLDPRTVTFKKQGKHAKPKVQKVFAGGSTNFAVGADGKVWVWGPNNYGQCGVPSPKDALFITQPTVIEGIEGKVVKVVSAIHHSVVLTEDGKVYSFGRGSAGRLGHGDEKDCPVPTVVKALLPSALAGDKVIEIGCGDANSMAVTQKGALYTWGYGDLHQLGLGAEDDVYVPTKVTGQQVVNRIILKVSSGSQHTIMLARDSEAKAADAKPEVKAESKAEAKKSADNSAKAGKKDAKSKEDKKAEPEPEAAAAPAGDDLWAVQMSDDDAE